MVRTAALTLTPTLTLTLTLNQAERAELAERELASANTALSAANTAPGEWERRAARASPARYHPWPSAESAREMASRPHEMISQSREMALAATPKLAAAAVQSANPNPDPIPNPNPNPNPGKEWRRGVGGAPECRAGQPLRTLAPPRGPGV